MKKLMMMMMTLATVTAGAMSLADARGKIDSVIANPKEATAIIKQLSAADQKAFVAALNEAIASLPGSAEERAATALNVNSAAVAGAAKGNTLALIAEVFATAPLDSLTVINESFAKNLLNRASNPARTYTDAQFSAISAKVVEAVVSRVKGAADADVRGGFAALMMTRASNGSPADLAESLASKLGAASAVAKTEWFPAALASVSDYDPMLSGTHVEIVPDFEVTVMIAASQRHAVAVSAVAKKDVLGSMADGFGDFSSVDTTDSGILTLPRTTENLPWNPELPRGYNGQTIK